MNRSKNPQAKKTIRLHIVASYEDATMFKAAAKSKGMSLGGWIRFHLLMTPEVLRQKKASEEPKKIIDKCSMHERPY